MTQNKKSRIPLLLTIVIGIFILFLAWSAKKASIGGTDVTDSDYYSKGMKYNSTLVEKRAASVIGWSLQAALQQSNLTLNLTDKNNAPVSGANAQATFPEPGNNRSRTFQLNESEPGTYLLTVPSDLDGEQLVRIEFERDGARINRQLLLNIAKPAVPEQSE